MRAKIATLLLFATIGCSASDRSGGDDQAASASPGLAPAPAVPKPVGQDTRAEILFLGTSLTAGYGVGTANAFPAVVQQKLDSAGLPFRVVNAGLSGETSAGGLRRLDWWLQQPVDVFVLELGANDGLRGLSVADLRANLDSILHTMTNRYPDADVLIAGMEAPPNLGVQYTADFRRAFKDMAKKYNAVLLPFLLDSVATEAELNQEDAIHPNIDGHKVVASNVWKKLEPMLRKRITKQVQEATG